MRTDEELVEFVENHESWGAELLDYEHLEEALEHPKEVESREEEE